MKIVLSSLTSKHPFSPHSPNILSGMAEIELELGRATRNAHGKQHTSEPFLRCKMKQKKKLRVGKAYAPYRLMLFIQIRSR